MKNIIFAADGTWNGPDRDNIPVPADEITNVYRLFVNLAGTDDPASIRARGEQERRLTDPAGNTTQVAKYLHGVGDSHNALVKLLGGAFGAGIIERIVRGYTFISREYDPGDRITIAGFSRGAYTARALAGMIASQGLLDRSKLDLSDKTAAYRLGAAVWHAWRRRAGTGAHWFSTFQEAALDLPAFLSAEATDKRIADVPIEAVAVWDTVGSLGIPDYLGISSETDVFRFADVKLSPKVGYGFHALAIDERRADFAPTWWQPDPRIIQCMFAGAHGDVGGGYPMANKESCLADCAFIWMKDHLAAIGVDFRLASPIPLDPDPRGPAHQPWLEFPFSLRPQGPRELPDALSIAPSVRDRLAAPAVMPAPDQPPRRYNPINLGEYV